MSDVEVKLLCPKDFNALNAFDPAFAKDWLALYCANPDNDNRGLMCPIKDDEMERALSRLERLTLAGKAKFLQTLFRV